MAILKPIRSVRHYVPPPTPPAPPMGAGDAVALVAKPIARAIDAVAGTSIVNCPPCNKRQEGLNKAVPDLPGLPKRVFKKIVGLFKK